MRVEDFLRDSARRLGARTAIVAGGQRLTFAELDRMSDRLAAALVSHGVLSGDRVLLFMDNSRETAVSIFAVLKAGAVFSPINPTAGAQDLAFVANDSRAAALVTQSRFAAISAKAMAEAPSLRLTVIAGCRGAPGIDGILRFEDAIAGSDSAPGRNALGSGNDPAMLVYGSAAMGPPKGTTSTHDKLTANIDSIAARLGCSAEDVVLCLLPIGFDDGFYQLLTATKVGATLVLEEPGASLKTIFRLVAEEGVTALPLAPAMGATIREMMRLPPGAFPSLRRVTVATGLPAENVAKLRKLFLEDRDEAPPVEDRGSATSALTAAG